MNLIGNAVKFTDQGEVSFRVRLEKPGQRAGLRFEVADTGIGISPAKRHMLFRPFSQADSSRLPGALGEAASAFRLSSAW